MRLVIVRHGRSTANADGVLAGRTAGVHLDETGRQQAEALRDPLAAVAPAAPCSAGASGARWAVEPLPDGTPHCDASPAEVALPARVDSVGVLGAPPDAAGILAVGAAAEPAAGAPGPDEPGAVGVVVAGAGVGGVDVVEAGVDALGAVGAGESVFFTGVVGAAEASWVPDRPDAAGPDPAAPDAAAAPATPVATPAPATVAPGEVPERPASVERAAGPPAPDCSASLRLRPNRPRRPFLPESVVPAEPAGPPRLAGGADRGAAGVCGWAAVGAACPDRGAAEVCGAA